ncbi:MAG: substrate-binding domain-containing protein, partial [Chitinophagaceae bacterium]
RKQDYTHYVILPHFVEGGEKAHEVINEITGRNLIILDKIVPGIKGEHGAVFENFENDIFVALKEALPQLSKYQTLRIIFPSDSYHPEEIVKGFQNFCQQYAFNSHVIQDISGETISEGEAYINLKEDDLVVLLGKIQQTQLKVGKDVGIISYNETPWKQFILDGLTTISTDFKKMGEIAAEMILNNERKQVEVPFALTLRNSL